MPTHQQTDCCFLEKCCGYDTRDRVSPRSAANDTPRTTTFARRVSGHHSGMRSMQFGNVLASSRAIWRSRRGHAVGPEQMGVAVYLLNMGQPVIVDLAERMIRLSGLEPGRISISPSRASGPASACTRSCSRRGADRPGRHRRHCGGQAGQPVDRCNAWRSRRSSRAWRARIGR